MVGLGNGTPYGLISRDTLLPFSSATSRDNSGGSLIGSLGGDSLLAASSFISEALGLERRFHRSWEVGLLYSV